MNSNKNLYTRASSFCCTIQQATHIILCPQPIKIRKNQHKTSPIFNNVHTTNLIHEKTNMRNNLLIISPASSTNEENEYFFLEKFPKTNFFLKSSNSDKKNENGEMIHSILLLRQCGGENPVNKDPLFGQEFACDGDISLDI